MLLYSSPCPSVCRYQLGFISYLIYYAIGKILRSYYAEHNVWSYDMEEGGVGGGEG